MKKLLPLSIVFLFLISCSTKRHAEIALNSGNYNQVINTSVIKLRNNKYKKRNFEYVLMLQDAFYKAAERDLNTIKHLKKANNPEHYRKIYELYLALDSRQNLIKPLLPIEAYGENIVFNFKNYSNDIISTRDQLSRYTYDLGTDLLKSKDKRDIRQAYNTFKYLNNINPGYANTRDLLKEAHQLGTSFVYVSVVNESNVVMPRALEQDLLDLDNFNHNKFWSVYHTNPNSDYDYDYAVHLNIKNIAVSPEQVKMREYVREREVIDGWKYELDVNGNVAKDSLGNDIKVDKIVKIKCNLLESVQFKSARVIAEVQYVDLATEQIIDKFPLSSDYVFENVFAKLNGDERALIEADRVILNNSEVAFPTDEQMVYDTGEDLKQQLRDLIKSYTIKI